MARILAIDDEPEQLELRALLLERQGHVVQCEVVHGEVADSKPVPEQALERAIQFQPDVVLMDLLLPTLEAGSALLKALRGWNPQLKIIVLSGWSGPMPDGADVVLRKPVRTPYLFQTIAKLMMLWLCGLFGLEAAEHRFEAAAECEAIAVIRSAGPDGALATLRVDQEPPFHVTLFANGRERSYAVFLGRLMPGKHVLQVDAPSGVAVRIDAVRQVARSDAFFDVVANAPVLFARADTIGKFSDVPLLMYATRAREDGQDSLEYTVIFSNEDGGTSTRNLMARWGRVTDIEYIYRVWQGNDGTRRAIIQAKDHKDIPYAGVYENDHPLLIPVTENNMVSFEGRSAVRYQLAPVLVDLSHHSREQVMDEDPETYAVAARELAREGKLRPYGAEDGEKISDPRNYVVVEARLGLREASVQVLVQPSGSDRWYAGSLGYMRNLIDRSGWIRTAIELPPGSQVAAIAFQCVTLKPDGTCTVEKVGRVFQLGQDYVPGPDLVASPPAFQVTPGEIQPIYTSAQRRSKL